MYNQNDFSKNHCLSHEQVNLLNIFQRLWYEHIIWTREFLISTAFDFKNLDAVTKRLLENPVDFAKAFNPLFGAQMAMTFQKLLTEHLLTGAGFLNAIKARDTKTAKEEREKWYANSDDISSFLQHSNPYWSKNTWQSLFYSHLEMIELDFIQLLSGKYTDSINQYDAMQDEAMQMADYMAFGIIKLLQI